MATPITAIPTDALPADNRVEADEEFTNDCAESDTTSVTSATYRGYYENGRRYQSLSDKEYYCPSDDKQIEAEAATHLTYLILDSQRENPLFQSPLGENAKRVLDLGTGSGEWPINVSEEFPNLTVHGVDLSPPPHSWVPPNCVLEVDDISKPWTWKNTWDLIHMRYMTGAFDAAGFDALYKQAFDNLEPGGWIEQLEGVIGFYCDDGTLPASSPLVSHEERLLACSFRAGRPLDAVDHVESRIRAAGFTNIKTLEYKVPIGAWAKHPIYKDAGRVKKAEVMQGIEGWCLFFLTKYGAPQPWSAEEAKVLVEQMRADFENPRYHIYQKATRVWAQKPF